MPPRLEETAVLEQWLRTSAASKIHSGSSVSPTLEHTVSYARVPSLRTSGGHTSSLSTRGFISPQEFSAWLTFSMPVGRESKTTKAPLYTLKPPGGTRKSSALDASTCAVMKARCHCTMAANTTPAPLPLAGKGANVTCSYVVATIPPRSALCLVLSWHNRCPALKASLPLVQRPKLLPPTPPWHS